METNEETGGDWQGANCVQRGISEALLRSEIGFWREMIESSRESNSPESIERMRFALALAVVECLSEAPEGRMT